MMSWNFVKWFFGWFRVFWEFFFQKMWSRTKKLQCKKHCFCPIFSLFQTWGRFEEKDEWPQKFVRMCISTRSSFWRKDLFLWKILVKICKGELDEKRKIGHFFNFCKIWPCSSKNGGFLRKIHKIIQKLVKMFFY